jgi:hypothetical protein
VGLGDNALEEMEAVQGHVRERCECPSPASRKRPRTCLAECGQRMVTRPNQRGGNATGNCSSMEEDKDKDTGRDEEDSEPALVTISAARISSPDPDQAVDQEEATSSDGIPFGWTRTKLEPDR